MANCVDCYAKLRCECVDKSKQARIAVKGDRDPGYGSTSKMISECANCLLRDTPDVPAGIWTPGAAMGHKLIKRLVDHAGLTFTVEAVSGSSSAPGIVGVHPVHPFGRHGKQQLEHPVADPCAGRAEFTLAVAVAAGQRDDSFRRAHGVRSQSSGRSGRVPGRPASTG